MLIYTSSPADANGGGGRGGGGEGGGYENTFIDYISFQICLCIFRKMPQCVYLFLVKLHSFTLASARSNMLAQSRSDQEQS